MKVRGHRVDLAEVEAAVLATGMVQRAVLLCYKRGEPDQRILAFYTAVPGSAGVKLEGKR